MVMTKHFLAKAHAAMQRDNIGHLWTPGSTAWRHYCDISDATVTRAQRDGYLSKHTGIPYLTREGYNAY